MCFPTCLMRQTLQELFLPFGQNAGGMQSPQLGVHPIREEILNARWRANHMPCLTIILYATSSGLRLRTMRARLRLVSGHRLANRLIDVALHDSNEIRASERLITIFNESINFFIQFRHSPSYCGFVISDSHKSSKANTQS